MRAFFGAATATALFSIFPLGACRQGSPPARQDGRERPTRVQSYIDDLKRQKAAIAIREIKSDNPWGWGAAAVRRFFECWKDRRYADMYRMVAKHSAFNPGRQSTEGFVKLMENSPINWRELEITDERFWGPPDVRTVSFRVKITDPASAYAAGLLNLQVSQEGSKRKDHASYRYTPFLLGIERFTPCSLAWRVWGSPDRPEIDFDPERGPDMRIDLIGYAETAGGMIDYYKEFMSPSRPERDASELASTAWLFFVKSHLIISDEDGEKIKGAAAVLVEKARSNLALMGSSVKDVETALLPL